VEIDGLNAGSFSEVSGVDISVDVIEYRSGTETINSPRKMPGLTKVSNVTLKWGMTSNMDFADWVKNIASGEHKTTEDSATTDVQDVVSIKLMDDGNEEVLATWELVNVWPCKYTGGDLNASSSEVSFESVELACDEIRRV
jgi:phage tail-like protein